MPHYLIRSADQSYNSAEITSSDAGCVLHIIGQLNLEEADVLEDNRYLFSARLGGNGVWSIFQRDHGLNELANSA